MAKNTTMLVLISSLHFEDNVRDEKCSNVEGMVDNIRRDGFLSDHPLVVEKLAEEQYLVLRGNRRGLACQWLAEHEPDTIEKMIPSGKIPAIVHENLTPRERILIRIDHGPQEDREPLSEWSTFLAIRQLVQGCEFTQEQIAEKLGIIHTKGKNKGKPNRSLVQPRVNLARLPLFVQEEMHKYCDDPTSTHLKWTKIPALYKAREKEFLDYPNGDGPLFKAAWEKALEPPKPKEDKSEPGKALSAGSARNMAQSVESPVLRDVLLTVTGQGRHSINALDCKIKTAEDAQAIVDVLRLYHGDNAFDEMVNEAIASMADNEEPATA